MEKVRIALLGAAHYDAEAWVQSLTGLEGVELGALWDHDLERGQRAAAAWGFKFQPDAQKLLAERGTAAVCIAAETSRRPELIAESAAAGKYVLCMAPPAASLDQHDRVLVSVQKNGAKFMPHLPMRFDPMSQRVRAMVAGGKLGKVDMIRLRLGGNRATTPGFAKSWQANAEVSGGGVLMDLGVHALDCLQWLVGWPVSVVAQTVSSLSLPVEDNVIAVYEFPRNLIAEVACSWVCHAATNTLEAFGEAGTAVVQGNDPASRDFAHDDFPRLYCTDFQERRWQPVETASSFKSGLFHGRVMETFVECVRGNTPAPVGAAEARNGLALASAAYESARQGRRMIFTVGERGLGYRPE